MDKFLWVEKYTPATVDDCILPNNIKQTLIGYRDSGNIPNVIFTGSSGLGKTSSILALAKELDLDILFVNGSNEGRYLATIQNLVSDFCSSTSFYGKRKLVLFDEFDNTLPDVQLCLRGIIEKFQNNTSFVFTCNNYNKILEAIRSRCTTLHYVSNKAETKSLMLQIFKRLKGILEAEGVTYQPNVLAEVVKNYYPDVRRTINELQRFSVTGTLEIKVLSSANAGNIDNLLILMKDKRKFNEVRKWASDNADISCETLFRAIGDKLEQYIQPGSIAQAIILLAQYQYRHAFVADAELNICAALLDISYSCNFIE
jgi:DNA polymerase III delta prime subunit